MRIEMPYGDSRMSAEASWLRRVETLDIADVPELESRDVGIARAIESPIGLDRNIYEIVQPGEHIAIIVSDSFRKTAVDQVLPVLLHGLRSRGVNEKDLCFIFASGTHRPPTAMEQAEILGPTVYDRFHKQAFTHDPNDNANLVQVGTTSRGTKVEVNRKALECDRIIATGAVVMHYFGGFGGGRKSIVPGISSTRTIAQNHSMNLDPHSDNLNPAVQIAALDGNPVAEDMLEGTRLVGVDYIVNTVLNREGKIARVFAGELEAAHRAAAAFAKSIYAVYIERRADLIIAASPHTRNFVQTHKALYNAFQAMKPGGRIILLAPCAEGLGSDRFVKWLQLGSKRAVITELRRESEINGQTALSTLEKAPSTILVTELNVDEVQSLGAGKAGDLAVALHRVRADLAFPDCYLMPSAAYSVPFVRGERVARTEDCG